MLTQARKPSRLTSEVQPVGLNVMLANASRIVRREDASWVDWKRDASRENVRLR